MGRFAMVAMAAMVAVWAGALGGSARETAMWGFTPGRNLAVGERGLPQEWDPATGLNIKWTAPLGSQTYAGPVVSGDKVFVGTNNRVGTEPTFGNHVFYGSSYFCNPRGEILAQGGDQDDELVVAELDLDQIREVRDTWQFFRDRRPETYQHCARQP